MSEVIEELIPNISFTVSARTARLIGQENFANAEGAVIELVKNSYDADATAALVIINPLKDTLYIYDNGDGMTEDVIKTLWMTIGTDDKKTNYKSNGQRVRSGAKGIGRFALDRLGNKCKMQTKTDKSEGVFWQVDWGLFEEKGAVISDVKAHLHEQNNLDLKKIVSDILISLDLDKEIAELWKENKGTLIEIMGLRDVWSDSSITSLYNNLEILAPPQKSNVFELYLFNANEPTTLGLVKSALCDDYDYKLSASANEDQTVKITVYRNELNVSDLIRNDFFKKTKLNSPQYTQKSFELGYFEINKTLQELVVGYKNGNKNNLEKIGPFSFDFYYMKRGGGQEKDEGVGKYPYKNVNYSKRAEWLDKFGGIKIFRDNFRVRPYGETKSSSFDWLDLGKRALSNPTVTRPGYAVRPQQIYGELTISRLGNVNFDDKSGREGLQENDIFTLFKEVVKSIIEIFENDRNQIMMSLKKIYDDTNRKEKAKKDADNIIDKNKKKSKTAKTSTSAEESETLIVAIETYKEEIDDLKDEQKLLRVLASAGLIVTSFAHELKNLSDSIVPRTEDLKEVLNEIIDVQKLKALKDFRNPYVMIDDIRTQDVRLKSWLDFALASVRKDKRSRRKINMVTYIEGLERTWSSLLARRKISLTVDKWKFLEVNFDGHEIDLDGIFNNLIANSVDAFKRSDAGDNRAIKLSFSYDPLNSAGIHVVYEDSGPGLEKEINDPNQIFQPFFTTKRDDRTGEKIGTGLGMWIVKSTLEEYKGDIEFLDIRPGFKVKIVLPNL